MFALGIRYLTGTAVHASPSDLSSPEWPPHPARVFMALVATWGETGKDASEADALRWLEGLGSPAGIAASPAFERSAAQRFVPVNDTVPSRSGEFKKAGILQSAPAFSRVRSGRFFPTVRPDEDRVFLIWEEELDERYRLVLEGLCGRVSRLGHSSSLVQVWLEEKPPPPTWRRNEDEPDQRFRAISPGLFDYLQSVFSRKPTQRPHVSLASGYKAMGEVEGGPTGSIWDPESPVMELTPLESSFRRLDLVSTLQFTQRLHEAAIAVGDEATPEVLSGHTAGGSPTSKPHVAFLPLPFSGHHHADGAVRGVALALPEGISRQDRRIVLQIVAEVGDPGPRGDGGLKIGRLGRWKLAPAVLDPPPETLRARTWSAATRGASTWGSVTPVVFDRHPKSDGLQYLEDVSEVMSRACRRIGLPEPARVDPLPVSVHPGIPASHEFPRMRRKDGSLRRHLHARLVFTEPVRGPISIGAGRFRGYGFFRPVRGG